MYRMRFDLRAQDHTPEQTALLYKTAVDMTAWADDRGCSTIVLSEHHAADDGYLPAPLTLAAAMAAVTSKTPILIAAALLPLYDPVRLAEEMVVLDHLSRGRVSYTLALGYRPVEYELYGVEWSRRGAIADEKLTVLLHHLRGSGSDGPIVTPRPFSEGGPFLTWGGQTKAAARRAGRNGIGFIAQSSDPVLGEVYRDASLASGFDPGLCILPPEGQPASVFVNDDLDLGWEEVGPSLLADAVPYWEWNLAAGHHETSSSLSGGTSVAALREANGSHRVVTVDEAVELIGQYGSLGLQPLSGGLDPEVAWRYLRRVVDDVLPAAASAAI